MTAVRIRPGPVFGSIRAPSSKSYTHRALVVGHLAGRPFRVLHPLDAEDTRTTAAALVRLGTSIVRVPGEWRVRSTSRRSSPTPVRIDCRESGTTLRFVATLAALTDRRVLLTGSRGLSGRPIDALLGALTTLGARCRHARGSGLPVEIQGPIHGGAVALDASQSSQFASSLLLALPTLATDSQLDLRGSIVSEPYLDATMAVLGRHGVRVALRGRRFRISGNQRYRGSTFRVPGDASSAAYLWAAAVLGGGTVRVRGIPLERWPQADLAVLELLERTGGRVRKHADGATVSSGPREPFWIDLTAAPDLYPLAGVLAATVPGKSRILGAEHVVLKESDRRAGTTELVRRFGARARVTHAGLVVEGREQPRPVSVPRLTDHRMVMSAAVGALAARAPSLVGTAEAVGKSFPGFWDALEELSRGRQRW